MSVQQKKRFYNLGKIIGIALFAFIMFTNIKIALMDDAEIASGDISVFGIELNLFEATYAEWSQAPGYRTFSIDLIVDPCLCPNVDRDCICDYGF